MEPDTDPDYAINQIDSFLRNIDDLQQMDYENPDAEREKTKLEINIRSFLRTNFKDDDKKLQDLADDRSSYISGHLFDPDNAITKQRNYENDLELIKYHLIAYKMELESIKNSRQKEESTPRLKRIAKKISANVPVVKKQISKEKNLENRKIFIVHGQNEEIKNEVESFLTILGLEPIILHKQANLGKTVIEKVEHYSGVSFAIIILEKEDIGSTVDITFEKIQNAMLKSGIGSMKLEKIQNITEEQKITLYLIGTIFANIVENAKPRARQNVIFEFGYFMGRLGRLNVRALYQEGVELPSDVHGMLYIPLDNKGEWKRKLACEINASGIKIDDKFL